MKVLILSSFLAVLCNGQYPSPSNYVRITTTPKSPYSAQPSYQAAAQPVIPQQQIQQVVLTYQAPKQAAAYQPSQSTVGVKKGRVLFPTQQQTYNQQQTAQTATTYGAVGQSAYQQAQSNGQQAPPSTYVQTVYSPSAKQVYASVVPQAPSPAYGAPSPAYGAPSPAYEASSPGYGAPSPATTTYGAVGKSAYQQAQSNGQQAPPAAYVQTVYSPSAKQVYAPVVPQAPSPAYAAPSPAYGAPSPAYEASSPAYGAPSPAYGALSATYGTSEQSAYSSTKQNTYPAVGSQSSPLDYAEPSLAAYSPTPQQTYKPAANTGPAKLQQTYAPAAPSPTYDALGKPAYSPPVAKIYAQSAPQLLSQAYGGTPAQSVYDAPAPVPQGYSPLTTKQTQETEQTSSYGPASVQKDQAQPVYIPVLVKQAISPSGLSTPPQYSAAPATPANGVQPTYPSKQAPVPAQPQRPKPTPQSYKPVQAAYNPLPAIGKPTQSEQPSEYRPAPTLVQIPQNQQQVANIQYQQKANPPIASVNLQRYSAPVAPIAAARPPRPTPAPVSIAYETLTSKVVINGFSKPQEYQTTVIRYEPTTPAPITAIINKQTPVTAKSYSAPSIAPQTNSQDDYRTNYRGQTPKQVQDYVTEVNYPLPIPPPFSGTESSGSTEPAYAVIARVEPGARPAYPSSGQDYKTNLQDEPSSGAKPNSEYGTKPDGSTTAYQNQVQETNPSGNQNQISSVSPSSKQESKPIEATAQPESPTLPPYDHRNQNGNIRSPSFTGNLKPQQLSYPAAPEYKSPAPSSFEAVEPKIYPQIAFTTGNTEQQGYRSTSQSYSGKDSEQSVGQRIPFNPDVQPQPGYEETGKQQVKGGVIDNEVDTFIQSAKPAYQALPGPSSGQEGFALNKYEGAGPGSSIPGADFGPVPSANEDSSYPGVQYQGSNDKRDQNFGNQVGQDQYGLSQASPSAGSLVNQGVVAPQKEFFSDGSNGQSDNSGPIQNSGGNRYEDGQRYVDGNVEPQRELRPFPLIDTGNNQLQPYTQVAGQSGPGKLLGSSPDEVSNVYSATGAKNLNSYEGSNSFMPYKFAWAVKNNYGNDYGHEQDSDAYGITNGQYRVLLPDGRFQTVTYKVTPTDGYKASVNYGTEGKYR